jgi:hypothetical protein
MAATPKGLPLLRGTILAVLVGTALPAATGGAEARSEPVGLLGVTGGFVLHSGRTEVVDGVSGASTRIDEDVYLQPGFAGGPVADLGFSTFGRIPGTLGVRLWFDACAPGPFFAAVSLIRYRLDLDVDRGPLRGIAPWFGVGAALQWKDRPGGEPFLSFPLSAGLDFGLLAAGLFVGLQLDVSMLNPVGPSWSGHDGGSSRQYQAHYNEGALKLTVTHRFY